MNTAVATISSQVYAIRDDFNQVSVDRSLKFDRQAGFAIQAITASNYAINIAKQNPQSVINAVTNIAAIGISLNPAKKQAYLVPRDNKICLDISYMGLMDLAMETGSIKWAQAALVYEQDTFALNGFDKPPLHQYNPFAKDRGEVIGVYVVVKTADGDYLTHAMDAQSVYEIRDRSAAWKAWISKKASCPWVTDEGEMMKKTCVKQAYKYWPKTERLEQAIHHLNTDTGEGLESLTKPAQVGCPADVLSGWIGKAKEAGSADELTKIWTDGLAVIKPTGDMQAYAAFKAAVSAKGSELKSADQPIEGESERVEERQA